MRMVAEREPKQAQEAAKQITGEVPMKFPYVTEDPILEHHPLMQRFLDPAFQYFFKFTQLVWNVFLDATKIEPQRWARQRTGIVYKGSPVADIHVAPTHSLLKLSVRTPFVFYSANSIASDSRYTAEWIMVAVQQVASHAILRLRVCHAWNNGGHPRDRQCNVQQEEDRGQGCTV